MDSADLPRMLEQLRRSHPELGEVTALLGDLFVALRDDPVQQADLSFVRAYPPGHFYTPLPSQAEVARVASRVWGPLPESLPGLDLNTRGQQRLFAKFAKHYKELPYRDGERGNLRYQFDNNFFSYADAIFLFCLLREFSPRRFVEIGSGHSSCVALDTADLYPEPAMACTFIEPYPGRLHSLLRPGDLPRVAIIEDFVQNVPMEVFTALEANDILFIDSSHVGKIGSDVLYELFEILPRLQDGVIVHFHDIFYPFEYPREWVEKSCRAWNENYFLRAFLQDNAQWNILFFNNYIGSMFPEMVRKWTPLAAKNSGGSLWLRKGSAPCSAP